MKTAWRPDSLAVIRQQSSEKWNKSNDDRKLGTGLADLTKCGMPLLLQARAQELQSSWQAATATHAVLKMARLSKYGIGEDSYP
jgi:hypothetical protein